MPGLHRHRLHKVGLGYALQLSCAGALLFYVACSNCSSRCGFPNLARAWECPAQVACCNLLRRHTLHLQSRCQICADRSLTAPCRCNRLLEPVMLEVKKMRTLSRRGSEMDEGVVLDKTNKYLVSD